MLQTVAILVFASFTASAGSDLRDPGNWYLTSNSGSADCPGYSNGSQCQEACLTLRSDLKTKHCMRTTIKSASDYDKFMNTIQSTYTAMRVTDRFDPPADKSDFYQFANKLRSGKEFCSQAPKAIDQLVEAKRTCPGGGGGSGDASTTN